MEKEECRIIDKYIIPIPLQNKEVLKYKYQITLQDFVGIGKEIRMFDNENILLYLENTIKAENKKEERVNLILNKLGNTTIKEKEKPTKEIIEKINNICNFLNDNNYVNKNYQPGTIITGYWNNKGELIETPNEKEVIKICPFMDTLKLNHLNDELKDTQGDEERTKIIQNIKKELDKIWFVLFTKTKKIIFNDNIFRKNKINYDVSFLYFNDKQDLLNCMKDIQQELGNTHKQKKQQGDVIITDKYKDKYTTEQHKEIYNRLAQNETIRQYFVGSAEAWENLLNDKGIQKATEKNGLLILCKIKERGKNKDLGALLLSLQILNIIKTPKRGNGTQPIYSVCEKYNIFVDDKNNKITDIRKLSTTTKKDIRLNKYTIKNCSKNSLYILQTIIDILNF
jgi:hypothetical protein